MRENMALSRIMIILISLLSFTCADKIRVLTMGEGVLPEHDVKAEILNTVSIRNMDNLWETMDSLPTINDQCFTRCNFYKRYVVLV